MPFIKPVQDIIVLKAETESNEVCKNRDNKNLLCVPS